MPHHTAQTSLPTVLLFGAQGQLGLELARSLSLLGQVVGADQAECNLCDERALRDYIRAIGPTLIVNAAAYTAVDKAEAEPELAERVNASAPRVMAEEARRLGAGMVHYSTDYVYNGMASTPYREDHPPAPLSVYGHTKLHGDQAIQAAGCPHLIFRTTWVYGHHGNNFVKTILRLARTRDELKIVDDQFGAPTWARLLAEATCVAVRQADAAGWDAVSGIYHMSAGGRTNWLEFAGRILDVAKSAGLLAEKVATLTPTDSTSYGAPAPRPRNSELSNEKLQRVFGLRMPDWASSLQQFFDDPAARALI